MAKEALNLEKAFKLSTMTVFGFFIILTILPVLIPLLLVLYLLSCFIALLIKLRHGKNVLKFGGVDALSTVETEVSYPIINVALRFKGKLNYSKFRNKLADTIMNCKDQNGIPKYKRMTQIYDTCFGYLVWRDPPQFNIDDHLKVIQKEDIVGTNEDSNLPFASSPSTSNTFEEETKEESGPELLLEERKEKSRPESRQWENFMEKVLNKFGAARTKEGIPNWECILCQENEERYTALFRFHHSIADGVYIARMLCEVLLDSPTKLFHSYNPPSTIKKIFTKLWSVCLLPFAVWKVLKNKDRNCLHGVKLCGIKKCFVSKSIPMKLLREIRSKTKCRIQGILLSCLAAGLASHFKRRDMKRKWITAVTLVPLQNLTKPIQLKNSYGAMTLKLPTSESGNSVATSGNNLKETLSPLERLRATKTILEEALQDPSFISFNYLAQILFSVLPVSVASSLTSTKGITAGYSNLPGPQEPLSFQGDPIEDMMFWVPDRNPVGVATSVLSYDDHLRFGITIDDALIRNEREGDLLIEHIESEVQNLIHKLDEVEGHTSKMAADSQQQFLKCTT